jgi:hypothetical protein
VIRGGRGRLEAPAAELRLHVGIARRANDQPSSLAALRAMFSDAVEDEIADTRATVTPFQGTETVASPQVRGTLRRRRRWGVSHLALRLDVLAGDRVSEDDPVGGDLELADLGVVGARA